MGLCCSESEKSDSSEVIRLKPNSTKVGLFNRQSINMVGRAPLNMEADSWEASEKSDTPVTPSQPRKIKISGKCSQKSEHKFVS